MARGNNLEKMSYAELAEMESDIARLKSSKQAEERTALKERLVAEAKTVIRAIPRTPGLAVAVCPAGWLLPPRAVKRRGMTS